MVWMSIFLDLLALKLCGKEGHAQRPDKWRGSGNPANNLPRRLNIHVFLLNDYTYGSIFLTWRLHKDHCWHFPRRPYEHLHDIQTITVALPFLTTYISDAHNKLCECNFGVILAIQHLLWQNLSTTELVQVVIGFVEAIWGQGKRLHWGQVQH